MDEECTGRETSNEIDEVIVHTEDSVAVAAGKGLITEDQYSQISDQIKNIRASNNRLKCLLQEVPESSVSPESIVKEMEETKPEVSES